MYVYGNTHIYLYTHTYIYIYIYAMYMCVNLFKDLVGKYGVFDGATSGISRNFSG